MADMTDEQAEEFLREFGEGKANMHSFFTNVAKWDETTRTGNLEIEELGLPRLPLRTLKELELFSKEIAGDDDFADYFSKLAEIQTATSLSKEGFFLKLAGTLRKEVADVTPTRKKENKGWFKKKDDGQ